MKTFPFLLIIITWFPATARAEFPVQGVLASCTKSQFEVSAQNVMMDETPKNDFVKQEDGREIYFGSTPRTVTCEVGTRTIKATVWTEEPRERGACGGEPGSNISISVGDRDFLVGQLFNNHCYDSLDSLTFSQSRWVGFVTKICGHTSGSNVEAKACFEFKDGTIFSFDLPLSPFPMEQLINPKLYKLAPNREESKRSSSQ